MNRIVLASQSPRRKELLALVKPDFDVVVSNAEEITPIGVKPEEIPVFLASVKAGAVAQEHRDDTVIGADTAVLLGNELLGKPKDDDDAARMLRALSGREHTVITGCCIIRGSHWLTFSEQTKVRFYELSEREIMEYIATGEPLDKAGAYGIQGKGYFLVEGITGDYYNVMGLPIARLRRELERMEDLA